MYIGRCLTGLLALGFLAGCGAPDEVYKRETFELDSPYQFFTTVSVELACESARRALLGQGYIIDSADAGSVKGKKAFLASMDESAVLEMNVVCIPRGEGATIFANAVQALYSVKKSAQSASVGVPVLGSISVPLAGSKDSLVKVGDATVSDKEFYQRFFAVVEYYVEQVTGTQPPNLPPPEGLIVPPISTPKPLEASPPAASGPESPPPAPAPESQPAAPETVTGGGEPPQTPAEGQQPAPTTPAAPGEEREPDLKPKPLLRRPITI